MEALKKIARHFGHHTEAPPPPVKTENSFLSMIFSAADDNPKASERLIRLALDAARIALTDVNLDDLAKRQNVPDYFTVWPGEHYRLLGGLMLALKPKVVIEVGTFSGLSALVLQKYLPQGGQLATFDLVPWNTIQETVLAESDFAPNRFTQHLGDLADAAFFNQHRALLESADFFFIDGPKNDKFEWAFMDHLRTLRGPNVPILMFDDTRLWSMLKFCRDLPHPKLDITSFGHWSGSLLAELTR